MELRTHDVVIVTGQNRYAIPRLPVPYTDGLIVGRTKDPGTFMVKGDSSDIVDVTI